MNLLKRWYYLACGSGKCKKSVTRKDGQLWCDTCNKPVSYPRSRFRLQVDVMDATAQTVIVMWEETASELRRSRRCLMSLMR
ncbi:nucleic acid-binding, OB-fold protein [Artemisia annua]|uniref:Nucleic acid-binding, OB-fold protein n=1 Tax=Artemisia annua TaxID=35608 RepID=A0A2U1P7E0_ARTAN|nr:nucleic acid-binding, OB-fold protein [Artemisia annua]